jgi:hypothetical protein
MEQAEKASHSGIHIFLPWDSISQDELAILGHFLLGIWSRFCGRGEAPFEVL